MRWMVTVLDKGTMATLQWPFIYIVGTRTCVVAVTLAVALRRWTRGTGVDLPWCLGGCDVVQTLVLHIVRNIA